MHYHLKTDDTMRVAGDVRQPMHTLNIGEQTIIIVKLWSRNKVVVTKTQRVRDMNNSMSSHIDRTRGSDRLTLNFWCVDETVNTSTNNNNANHKRRLKSIHILYVIGIQSFLCITVNLFGMRVTANVIWVVVNILLKNHVLYELEYY